MQVLVSLDTIYRIAHVLPVILSSLSGQHAIQHQLQQDVQWDGICQMTPVWLAVVSVSIKLLALTIVMPRVVLMDLT
jgi:hypothetical protein